MTAPGAVGRAQLLIGCIRSGHRGSPRSVQPLPRMPDIRSQLAVEIERVKSRIVARKRLIKDNIGKTRVIETAEQEMKALHTHLFVLEKNIAKETANPTSQTRPSSGIK